MHRDNKEKRKYYQNKVDELGQFPCDQCPKVCVKRSLLNSHKHRKHLLSFPAGCSGSRSGALCGVAGGCCDEQLRGPGGISALARVQVACSRCCTETAAAAWHCRCLQSAACIKQVGSGSKQTPSRK